MFLEIEESSIFGGIFSLKVKKKSLLSPSFGGPHVRASELAHQGQVAGTDLEHFPHA